MKQIFTYSLLLSLFVFPNCSKDVLKSYDRRIVGIWQLTDINRTGFGGSTDNLPFKSGEFDFKEDGSLTYTDVAGSVYIGSWNIQKKMMNETTYNSLEISVINFATQQVLSEYYDDINFTRTNHFKAKIEQGLHAYVSHFDR